MIRVLGLDVGKVRVGVALSDPLGSFAQPLEMFDKKLCDPVREVAKLVKQLSIQRIVVGRPLHMNGTEGEAVRMAEKFVRELERLVDVPIEWWDERLSSVEADRLLLAGGVKRAKRKQKIDQVAASVVLQSYLNAKGRDL